MTHGMVVAPEGDQVAAAGAYALQMGGNAVDAAIAAAFAQAVANPLLCGLGGTGEMLVYSALTKDVYDIDFGAVVPRNFPPDLFSAKVIGRAEIIGRYAVKGEQNQMGYLSVMVPSFVKGMGTAHLQFGSRIVPWEQLLLPAVRLARQGTGLNEYLAQYFRPTKAARSSYPALPDGSERPGYPSLEKKLQSSTQAASEFVFPHGQQRQVGSSLVQEALGHTLSEIAVQGADAFYTGRIGNRIAEDFSANGGYIDAQDLACYTVAVKQALEITTARGSLRIGHPPSAGMQLAQMVALVEHMGLPPTHNSADYVDRLARIMQVVFYDQRLVKTWRSGVSAPWEEYLAPQRIATLASAVKSPTPCTLPAAGRGGTTHVTTCDEHGNAVSLTHSIGSIAGAGVMADDLGFFYNNFIGHLNPSHDCPDSIHPGARIGSLCPAIWTQNGALRLALGSPGGSRLTTSALQTILNHLWLGFSIQAAVSLPRFHAEEENLLHVEMELPPTVRTALSQRRYSLLESSYMGRVQAIARLDGVLIPGADPRGGMGVTIV